MNTSRPIVRATASAFAIAVFLPAFASAAVEETKVARNYFRQGKYAEGFKFATNNQEVEKTPEIKYYIGLCYERGLGTERDVDEARTFYAASANDGNMLAKSALESLDRVEQMRNAIAKLEGALAQAEKKLEETSDDLLKERTDREANKERVKAKFGQYEKEIADLRAQLSDAIAREDDAEQAKLMKRLEDLIATIKNLPVTQPQPNQPIEIIVSPPQPNTTYATSQMPNSAPRQESPLGFAMFAPAQFPPVGADVNGFRLSVFYGRNNNVFGLDIGSLVSVADGDLMGLEVSGLFNQIGTSSGSLQVGGIANECAGDFIGFQIGGIANRVKGSFAGMQIGTLNLATDMDGLQVGAFNNAINARGLQIGVVNHAETMKGVQIGLINLIDKSPCPCIPVVNAYF